jgi:hypothetical protein
MTKETIEIEVSNDTVACEVAYGIIGRAQDIHDNPDNDFEWLAEELRDVGQDLLGQYE